MVGALWSAWRMRGRPELKDRFIGTLLIVLGATIIAGFGSAFAALGDLAPFSVALLVGHLGDVLGVPASVHAGVGPRGRAGHGHALIARSLA